VFEAYVKTQNDDTGKATKTALIAATFASKAVKVWTLRRIKRTAASVIAMKAGLAVSEPRLKPLPDLPV